MGSNNPTATHSYKAQDHHIALIMGPVPSSLPGQVVHTLHCIHFGSHYSRLFLDTKGRPQLPVVSLNTIELYETNGTNAAPFRYGGYSRDS